MTRHIGKWFLNLTVVSDRLPGIRTDQDEAVTYTDKAVSLGLTLWCPGQVVLRGQ